MSVLGTTVVYLGGEGYANILQMKSLLPKGLLLGVLGEAGPGDERRTPRRLRRSGLQVPPGCSGLGGAGGGARATRRNRASGGGAQPATSVASGLEPVPPAARVRCAGRESLLPEGLRESARRVVAITAQRNSGAGRGAFPGALARPARAAQSRRSP